MVALDEVVVGFFGRVGHVGVGVGDSQDIADVRDFDSLSSTLARASANSVNGTRLGRKGVRGAWRISGARLSAAPCRLDVKRVWN